MHIIWSSSSSSPCSCNFLFLCFCLFLSLDLGLTSSSFSKSYNSNFFIWVLISSWKKRREFLSFCLYELFWKYLELHSKKPSGVVVEISRERKVGMVGGWKEKIWEKRHEPNPLCPTSILEIMFLVLNWVFTVCNRSRPSIHFLNDAWSTENVQIGVLGLSISAIIIIFNTVQIKKYFDWMLFSPLINRSLDIIE